MGTNLITVSTTGALAIVGENSSPFFSNLIVIALIGTGFLVGGLLVAFLQNAIISAMFSFVAHMKKNAGEKFD